MATTKKNSKKIKKTNKSGQIASKKQQKPTISKLKTIQKRKKITTNQKKQLDQGDISALQQLIENLQEVHTWQHNLLQESARRIKNLAAAQEKSVKHQ